MGKIVTIPQKRTWLFALFGVPKEAFERGPRPPLHHPDVIKARKEREQWLKSKQTSTNLDSESSDS